MKREIPGLKPWPASVDKVQRAMAAQPTLESNNCWLPGVAQSDNSDYDPASTPGWVQDFVEECAQFNKGTNDDQVDAWSQAINYLNGSAGQVGGFYVPEGEI